MTYLRTVNLDPAIPQDAFSRVMVSSPEYVFDSSFEYSLQPLIWEPVTNGTGAAIAHEATDRSALMAFASTETGGKAYLQTYEYFRYQPGRSHLALITGAMLEAVADCTKFYGYGDDDDGVFFELAGTTAQWTVRSSTAAGDETVTQSNWNIDTLDGSGDAGNPSGMQLDPLVTNIIFIQAQWLGVGRVVVGFDLGGALVPVHAFNHANLLLEVPYTRSFNLPIRAGMTCTGTVSTTMRVICASVISEGGQADVGGYGHTTVLANTAGNNTRAYIGSIRPKSTFNSIANRIPIRLEGLDIIVTGNQPIFWELVIGDTLTSPTWSDVNTGYSATEKDTTATAALTPAVVLASGYVVSGASAKGQVSRLLANRYPLTLNAAGANRNAGTLSLYATGIGGTSAMRAALSWREIR